ncbi:MAG: hypothetical protein WCF78_04975, partial [archaeon]
ISTIRVGGFDIGEKVALKVKPGAGRKLANLGAGLVKGVVCTVVGNMMGDYALSEGGTTGLSNSVAIGKNIPFNKNILYMITLGENPDFVAPTEDAGQSEANKRAMYIINVEKFTGGYIPDDARIDSCVIPGAPSLINSGSSTTPGTTPITPGTTPTTPGTSTRNFSGLLPVRSQTTDNYIISKYIGTTKYQGQCLQFAREVGTDMFNYPDNWNPAPNAWTAAANNQSLGTYSLSSLNYNNLIPGSILGVYIDGANQAHGLTADQYSHVVLYVGDFDGKKHVVMDGGWTNNNQTSFYTTIEEYFAVHQTYSLREVILPKDTLDATKKQEAIACLVNKNEICNYS